jgi:fibronectin type 3 domain-containing protein
MIVNTHRNLAVSTKYMAHTLTGLATNTKYKVKVVSVNVAGVRSAATSEFVVETNYGTAQPTTSNANLRQKSNWAQSIELEWNTQPNNVLYRVHLYDISSRVYQSATVSATNYQFTGL